MNKDIQLSALPAPRWEASAHELNRWVVAHGGVEPLGVSVQGRTMSAPWLAPGYVCSIVDGSWQPALLVLRALVAGARVRVISSTPRVWRVLADKLSAHGMLSVVDARAQVLEDDSLVDLTVVDTPHAPAWLQSVSSQDTAVILVVGAVDEQSLPAVRGSNLVIAASTVVPAQPGSYEAALVTPEFALSQVPREHSLLRADDVVYEFDWQTSLLERQLLGLV